AWATVHWGGHEGTLLAWIPLASYVAILSLIGVVTTYFTPETRGRDLDDLRDAADAPVNGFAAAKLAEEN
ncbi:hypothetical protein QMN58_23800, partial [Escherichia coli]|nr:hypothetical protein [Escherichia coli]